MAWNWEISPRKVWQHIAKICRCNMGCNMMLGAVTAPWVFDFQLFSQKTERPDEGLYIWCPLCQRNIQTHANLLVEPPLFCLPWCIPPTYPPTYPYTYMHSSSDNQNCGINQRSCDVVQSHKSYLEYNLVIHKNVMAGLRHITLGYEVGSTPRDDIWGRWRSIKPTVVGNTLGNWIGLRYIISRSVTLE
jgi:hypothetical protein